MKRIITLSVVGILISVLFSAFYSFAEERITLTTYYPAPYGVYKEMRTNRLAVGSDYRDSPLYDGFLIVNGSVGIGTSAPQERLSIQGSDEMLNFHVGATQFIGSNVYYGGSPKTARYVVGGTDKFAEKIHFGPGTLTLSVAPDGGTAGGEIPWKDSINIGNAGNVTIGYRLDVSGDIDTQGSISTGRTIDGIPGRGAIRFLPGNNGSRYWINNYAGESLRFSTGTPPGTLQNVRLMTLRENGNVGIGTINPTEKLEVNGKLKVGSGTITNGWPDGAYCIVKNTDGECPAPFTEAVHVNDPGAGRRIEAFYIAYHSSLGTSCRNCPEASWRGVGFGEQTRIKWCCKSN